MNTSLQDAIAARLQRQWPRAHAQKFAGAIAAVLPKDVIDGARRAQALGLDLNRELGPQIAPIEPLWPVLQGAAFLLAESEGAERAAARHAFKTGLFNQLRVHWPRRTANKLSETLAEIITEAAADMEKVRFGTA